MGKHAVYSGIDGKGKERRFRRLVFHGGMGETLEHRVFNTRSLARQLRKAGFINVKPLMEDLEDLGAEWQPWSRIWLAEHPSET